MYKIAVCIGFLIINGMNYADQARINYFFSHGIGDSHRQAYLYLEKESQKKPYIITKNHPLITFDYADVSNNIFKINRTQTSLAQENEIKRLSQAYFEGVKKDVSSILIGVSRGASTLINFMALHNPENVAALILESPFDCVENILSSLIHETKLAWIPGFKRHSVGMLSFVFCKYRADGARPMDLAPAIRPDLPILIVCSAQDNLVPVWSSINLYSLLRQSGHENTYLLLLPEGGHAKLITNTIYGSLYQHVTHAFYQKFQLPHDESFAKLGIPFFSICQPNPSTLQFLYPNYSKTTRNTIKKGFNYQQNS
jgi:hypothetical protein